MFAVADPTFASRVVAYTSLVAGLICMVVGAAVVRGEAKAALGTKTAASRAAQAFAKANEGGQLQQQGALADGLDSVAKLASALKDLDVGTRVLMVGLALFAIAAVAAGTGAIAGSIAG